MQTLGEVHTMGGFAPIDAGEIAKLADDEQRQRPYLNRQAAVMAAYFAPRRTSGDPAPPPPPNTALKLPPVLISPVATVPA